MKLEIKGDLEALIIKIDLAIAEYIHKTGSIMGFERVIKRTIAKEIKKGGDEKMTVPGEAVAKKEPEEVGELTHLPATKIADETEKLVERKKKKIPKGSYTIRELKYHWNRASVADQKRFIEHIQKFNRLGELICTIK